MRYFMTVTPWILVETTGEKLEARWSFKSAPGDSSSLGFTRLARIEPGFSFDRSLLGLTALSIMSNVMEDSLGLAETMAGSSENQIGFFRRDE